MIKALAALTAVALLPLPAQAATWSPKDIQTAVYAAGGLGLIGAAIYSNEVKHHQQDNARNQEIQDALLEHRARLQAPAADSGERGPAIVRPTLGDRYVCTAIDPNGVCTELRLRPNI